MRPGVSKCRLGFAGWIEVPFESRDLLTEVVRWFGRACEHPPQKASTRKSKNSR